MLIYDEAKLLNALAELPAVARGIFAAACAERALPWYRRFVETSAVGGDPALAELALDSVWTALEQPHSPSPKRFRDTVEAMVPDSDQEPWSEARALGQNALIALAYAIEATVEGDHHSAASCARHLYELVDQMVLLRSDLDLNDPQTEDKVAAHTLVQSELQRQQRDLDDLRAMAKNDTRAVIVQLRDRAREDAHTLLL